VSSRLAIKTESSTVTLEEAVRQGTRLLENEGISAPRLTAEVLLSHAIGQERAYLYAHSNDELTEIWWIHYGRYLHERLKGKPTQYITHRQEFFGRHFAVGPNVLIPRPETEHLVETAVAAVRDNSYRKILDVGTGSGAIAISIALETGTTVIGSDISTDALQVAHGNRDFHRAPVHFFSADLVAPVCRGSLDLLVSNPPYVPARDKASVQREVRDWEPEVALYGGYDGDEVYRRLILQARDAIRPSGQFMLEMGYRSLDRIRPLLEQDWTDLFVVDDLAGFPRVLAARRR
jgi:release factor glutamine methyltransferase